VKPAHTRMPRQVGKERITHTANKQAKGRWFGYRDGRHEPMKERAEDTGRQTHLKADPKEHLDPKVSVSQIPPLKGGLVCDVRDPPFPSQHPNQQMKKQYRHQWKHHSTNKTRAGTGEAAGGTQEKQLEGPLPPIRTAPMGTVTTYAVDRQEKRCLLGGLHFVPYPVLALKPRG
jgi:hypothetical protein